MDQEPGRSDPKGKKPDRESGGFSAEERAAMKERAREFRAESRRGKHSREDGERDVLAKIAEMPEQDRQMALRLHGMIKAGAPALVPKIWYSMPAYALEDKVICFFQGAKKFNSRYATFGFSDAAKLDEGEMWPTSFALLELTPAVEEMIAALISKAVR